MFPRRCRAVLLLTAVLLAGMGSAHGQPAAAPPPAWASAADGAAPTAAPVAGRVVIATTHGQTPPQSPSVTPGAVPDDGLEPPPPVPAVAPFPAPIVQAAVVGTPAPGAVQPAVFRPDADTPAVRPAMAVLSLTPGSALPGDLARRSAAQVDVEVAGPPTVAPGEPLHYEIIVRNLGAAPVAMVHVEEPLPPGARLLLAEPPATAQADLLSWEVGNLEAGGERRLKVTLQHSGLEDLLCTPRVAYTAALGLRTRVVRPPFAVTLSGPETADQGATVPFRIEAANNGLTVLRRVVIRDRLPPGLRHPQGELVQAEIGDLAPGQSRSLQLEAVAVQGGSFINEATATADGGIQAASRVGIRIRVVGLALRLDAPRQAATGQEIDCRLEATNPTKAAVKGVRLTLTLPDGLEFRSANSGGVYDPASRRVVWAPGALAAGQMQAVVVRLRGQSAGEWNGRATAEADTLGAAQAPLALRVESGPALQIELLAQEDPLPLACETVYLVHLRNQGEGQATNVRLAVALPDGLTPLQAEGPTTCHVGPQQVTAEPLASVTPGQTVEYRVRVRGRNTGTWRLEANATADQAPQPVREQAAVHVTEDSRAAATPFASGR